MSKIRLAGIVKQSITDGPGLRLTLFPQGCPHHCEGCHNPETWAMDGGKEYGVDEIMAMVRANPLLKGVTFSGGEPLIRAGELTPVAKEIKEMGKDIVCYTGFVYEDIIDSGDEEIAKLLEYVDILVDGPYIKDERDITLVFRGSKNQRLIDLNKSRAIKATILFEI